MAKGYWIAHITVRDAEAYKEYVARDTPIIEGFGGRFIVRGGDSVVPEGETFERHVVIEFPSYAAARAAYDSPEYQEVAAIRQRTADSVVVVVEGAE
jgi:uncharacterized protein (DUF1330 family)